MYRTQALESSKSSSAKELQRPLPNGVWRVLVATIMSLLTMPFIHTDLENYHRNLATKVLSKTTYSDLRWSAKYLMQTGQESMLAVPEEMYKDNNNSKHVPLSECPIRLYVYNTSNLPADLSTELEQWVVKSDVRLENIHTELALIRLFRTSPCRVYNASMADVFIVPYMHTAHCVHSEGYKLFCGNVRKKEIKRLLRTLSHYKDYRDRHAFLLGWGTHKSRRELVTHPLTLTVGWKHAPERVPETAVIIPPINIHPSFQPSVLLERDESFWTRPRQYSMVAFMGTHNPRMPRGPRRYRKYFFDYAKNHWNGTLGGKPYLLVATQGGKNSTTLQSGGDAFAAYHDSVFCPILPGDSAWQRRFFDVLMSGCLPLVIEWEMERGLSWHTPEEDRDPKDVYPFFPGGFYNERNSLIDYNSFVVRVPGNRRKKRKFSAVQTVVEELLANPQKLKQKQLRLMENAPKLAYGLGLDAHKYDDVFHRILKAMAQYSASL